MRGDAPTSLVTTGLCRKEVRACLRDVSQHCHLNKPFNVVFSFKHVNYFQRTIHFFSLSHVEPDIWYLIYFFHINTTQTEILNHNTHRTSCSALTVSLRVYMLACACILQPWESQSFCSTFPYEIVCADSWGQSLLAATDTAGVMLLDGEVTPDQYLPMSSKIKPPIHIRSILALSRMPRPDS